MTDDHMNADFANTTFGFLKKAFLSGDKENTFQPRGPAKLRDGDWEYRCEVKGDIAKFSGHESITKNDKIVFTHQFFGGLAIGDD